MIKLIGVLSMVADHSNRILFDGHYLELFWFGRLAFPIFCFYIARNYFLTRDVRRYAIRLFAFAFVSQPIYTAALGFLQLNILFTFFFCLLAIHFLDTRNYLPVPVLFVLSLISDGGLIAFPLIVVLWLFFSRYGVPVDRSSINLGRMFFYFFYPAHLLALFFLGVLVNG